METKIEVKQIANGFIIDDGREETYYKSVEELLNGVAREFNAEILVVLLKEEE